MKIQVLNFSELILLHVHILVNFFQNLQAFNVKLFLMLNFFTIFGLILVNHPPWLLAPFWLFFLFLVVLSFNLFEQVLLSSLEHGVFECVFLVLLASFMKIIHV